MGRRLSDFWRWRMAKWEGGDRRRGHGSPLLAGLSHALCKLVARPDWMAGDAVLIAPVSAPIPCKQGILQGIPRNLAIKGTSAQPKAPMLLAFFPQFPTQASREKKIPRAGNLRKVARNMFTDPMYGRRRSRSCAHVGSGTHGHGRSRKITTGIGAIRLATAQGERPWGASGARSASASSPRVLAPWDPADEQPGCLLPSPTSASCRPATSMTSCRRCWARNAPNLSPSVISGLKAH